MREVRLGSRRWARVLTAAVALAMAATLAACAETGGGADSAGGESVAFGSPKEDFIEALSSMDPVTLTMQSTAPKGSPTGRRFEDYAAAVEDWSGGKISMDIAFSNAIAPPLEVDDAIADTRIDVGSVMAAGEPDSYPAMAGLMGLTFLGGQGPVDGTLQAHAAFAEAGFKSDAIVEEYENVGLKILLPIFFSGPIMLACSDPITDLDSIDGRIVATQSREQAAQAKALGMSTASVTYAEMFEALERGVVDCAMTTLGTAMLTGIIPAAPYMAVDLDTGLSNAGGAIAIGRDAWGSLPVAGQQLLFDRIDVLLEANIRALWEGGVNAMAEIEKSGGSVVEFDAETAKTLSDANGSLVEAAKGDSALGDSSVIEDLVADDAVWAEKIAELPGVDVDYDAFASFDPETFDLKPYLDLLWTEVFLDERPTE